jgi:hypothetical protein
MPTITLSQRERETFVSQQHGLLMRVAKHCHVSHSLVSRVFHGLNTSARVQKALDTEINRALRKVQRQQERWQAKAAAPKERETAAPETGPEIEAVA